LGRYTISVCNQPTRSTQPCRYSRVAKSSTSFGWGKGGNVSSAGWQVTLCDPMWHVSSRSSVATLRTAIHLLLTYLPPCTYVPVRDINPPNPSHVLENANQPNSTRRWTQPMSISATQYRDTSGINGIPHNETPCNPRGVVG